MSLPFLTVSWCPIRIFNQVIANSVKNMLGNIKHAFPMLTIILQISQNHWHNIYF
uniref:Uncharacterized protein n=1 Tax=Rhizophora mucronata TaxID=61149 RepID=A0A2P2MIL7_RHIMU